MSDDDHPSTTLWAVSDLHVAVKANKAVVEIAPGVQVTFHLGVLTPEPETTTEPAGAEAAPETQTAPETETPSSDEGTGSHIADPRETK